MTRFLFSIPQNSHYSEFGSRVFKFLKAQNQCAFFISTGQLYGVVYCLLCILAPPKVLFIRLEARVYVNGTLIYDKVPKIVFILNLALASSNFEGPKSVCPFH